MASPASEALEVISPQLYPSNCKLIQILCLRGVMWARRPGSSIRSTGIQRRLAQTFSLTMLTTIRLSKKLDMRK